MEIYCYYKSSSQSHLFHASQECWYQY